MSQIAKPTEQKVKRMNVNVPIELHNSFKSATAAQGQNMTDVLMEFIQNYVAKYSPEGTAQVKRAALYLQGLEPRSTS